MPIYFDKSYFSKDHYDVLKASCALPVFCKPYWINDIPCLDGSICDPIPIDKVLSDGCDKVWLILTRPVDQLRNAKKDRVIADLLSHTHTLKQEKACVCAHKDITKD